MRRQGELSRTERASGMNPRVVTLVTTFHDFIFWLRLGKVELTFRISVL